MPIITEDRRDFYLKELKDRYGKLLQVLEGTPAKFSNPLEKPRVIVNKDQLGLAIGDFKNVLMEVSRIK